MPIPHRDVRFDSEGFFQKGHFTMPKNNGPDKNRIPFASRIEIALCVLLGCLNILAFAIFSAILDIDVAVIAVIITILYLLEIAFIGIRHKDTQKMVSRNDIYDLLCENGSVVIKNTLTPIIALDSRGTILLLLMKQ